MTRTRSRESGLNGPGRQVAAGPATTGIAAACKAIKQRPRCWLRDNRQAVGRELRFVRGSTLDVRQRAD